MCIKNYQTFVEDISLYQSMDMIIENSFVKSVRKYSCCHAGQRMLQQHKVFSIDIESIEIF
jgi:hypothetical protein